MDTRAQCKMEAARLNVSITDEHARESYYQDLEADAPNGSRFCATGTHHVVAIYFDGVKGSKMEAWASLLSDIGSGVEFCPTGGDAECHAVDCASLEGS